LQINHLSVMIAKRVGCEETAALLKVIQNCKVEHLSLSASNILSPDKFLLEASSFVRSINIWQMYRYEVQNDDWEQI
ncbi:hypothetical protein PMAYCL1PPCAC_19998, partial [Pristionchus mayeri]